ncbi:ABC transporter ATP-binding protein [Actinoallomurus rhizosphaericola]|uniref:ABC transporter ATP-binding protein n=1 Tax=Actinoallomurus rhizosphaericola TaxID=2952536 RepID=UPI00209096A2|nr:ABC transporter ATP-binding protein [Actinoallomurus rhizosphaericola]MCO5992633.1 ABC transporter ATP-binding protein/permease [Actinoallomurus rhizosphaericola]
MRSFPVADPGTPDHRSAARYLLWAARAQAGTMAGAAGTGVLWMVSQALVPAVIGRAIDAGLTARDARALTTWSGVLLALGVVQAATGVLRHRLSTVNWLGAAFRTIQVTTRQAVRLGATLPKRLAGGEVVSVGIADVSHIGGAMDIVGRGSGAVISIAVVGVILLTTSWRLGLIVLAGVPLLALVVGPLLRPLHHRQQRQRELNGGLTTRAGDIVAGLRVLRGIGGEQFVAARYRAESQAVRAAGVRVARTESLLDGAQVLLPGLLVALVTWAGARYALSGEITTGQLVSFYGYAVFLIDPLRTLTEAADKITKAHVAARRVVRILGMTPELSDEGTRSPIPGDLVDEESGVVVRPGRLTAVAATAPEDAQAIADRIGRFADGAVTWGGVPLRELPLRSVREAVMVADNEARLFSGRLLDELGGTGDGDAHGVRAALRAACAEDVVDELPDGLRSVVAEGGREFSGGQQQRLRLARALAADPEVLVLVEPTSAVDAHAEARIAARLREFRGGRTTLVCTTSPLVLAHADDVVFVAGGRAVATGPHRELLGAEPAYAATVNREELIGEGRTKERRMKEGA